MRNLIIILIVVSTVHLSATIINIPDDFDSIQQGLDFVAEDDTILVAEGVYFENIIWPETTGIQLIGSNKENCIIDGYQNGSVIFFENQVDSATLVSNFTITNGSTFYGGGIFCISSPHLESLVISGNNANYGGGICCTKSAEPIISEVEISNNTASDNGGGLYCFEGGDPTLLDVIIKENTAEEGAGVCSYNNSNISLTRALISNNTATGGYSSGGGIMCSYDSSISLINVTITDNTAEIAGGIACDSSSSMSLLNCIIWNNSGLEIYDTTGIVVITYSDIEEGWEGVGNIDSNPLFDNNYYLTENSPCIDSGDPSSSLDPDDTIADMGAFYYDQGTGIDENYELQIFNYSLNNYPNPFNPTTIIKFSLQYDSNIEISIFNIKGQKVKTLTIEQYPKGNHSVVWNGNDDLEIPVSSSIYFYKLHVNGKTEAVSKCLLLK